MVRVHFKIKPMFEIEKKMYLVNPNPLTKITEKIKTR